LVASSGGHLKELHVLRPRLSLGTRIEWVTFDTPQARSLLAGERVHFVPIIAPRHLKGLLCSLPAAWRILRAGRYGRVFSTGSGVALAFLPLARALGSECHYIESAARRSRPSLTGRVLSLMPGIRLYAQSREWANTTWTYGGSVFDGFEPVISDAIPIRRVVVTLGTLEFPFRRLIRRVAEILPPDVDVLWQIGTNPGAGLPGRIRRQLPAGELSAAIRKADVIIAHAGIGSVLDVLETGRCPVLVPRLKSHSEHVDSHQQLIADELTRRGLAITRDACELELSDLLRASAVRVINRNRQVPFVLRTQGEDG
jgi:UDP-N-acetylglucosamine transferase subunit ALG13